MVIAVSQPVGNVYVINAVPILMPHSVPNVGCTVAIVGSDEDHVPPVDVVNNGLHEPTHIRGTPVIAAGSGFTVMVIAVSQPVGSV